MLRDLADQRAALADAPYIDGFDDSGTARAEIAALEAELIEAERLRAEIKARHHALHDAREKLRAAVENTDDEILKADLQARHDSKHQEIVSVLGERRQVELAPQRIRDEIRAAEAKLHSRATGPLGDIREMQVAFDTAYVVLTALAQQPDADRIRAAHTHVSAMIRHNRIFWARLADETDNDREWIPNDAQVSALPLTVPPGLADSWQDILTDIEALLQGKLLIPHPLFPDGHGISLLAYVDDPSSLEIVGWLHGISAYRYAAKGPRISTQRFRAFQRLSLGNAGGFALLFN